MSFSHPVYDYNEYPVLCMGCFEPVASRVKEFHDLLNTGKTNKEALDEMEIFEECTRTAFMNPSIVFFNVENQNMIDGKVPINEYLETPVKTDVANKPIEIRNPIGTRNFPSRIPLVIPTVNPDVVKIEKEVTEFQYPEHPGQPTYNPDPLVEKYTVNVGSGYNLDEMSGRTYLAE